MFNWAIFENHWDLLLRDCATGRETKKHSHNSYENACCPTNKASVTS